MSLAYFTLVPMSILIWICVLVVLRNTTPNTSIQLNIDTSRNAIASYKTKKYHVPKYMLELYEQNKAIKANATRADVVRSVIPKRADKLNDNEVLQADNHLLVFDLPSCEDEEEFVGAELRILSLVEVKFGVGVERQLTVSIYDDATKKFSNTHKIHVHHLNNTWLSFNVTEAVVKMLARKCLKLVISVRACLPGDGFQLSLMPPHDDLDHDYPILLLSYTSKPKKRVTRRKRSVEEDYEEETNKIWDDTKGLRKMKKGKNACKRKPLYINFSEINFDVWIVQPPGYEAYQCQGKCFYPVAEHLNPTKHAIVQALLHSVSPAKVSRSCCVPTLLDSISILYVDTNGVLTYRYAYKDMVVIACGCR